MENFLISTVMVLAVTAFALGLIGAAMTLGRLFSSTVHGARNRR